MRHVRSIRHPKQVLRAWRWCLCNIPLSLPAIATLIAEFLTELDLRQITVVCNDPFPFGALSKRRVPDDVFMTWIHPLRHNRKVRLALTPRHVPHHPASPNIDHRRGVGGGTMGTMGL